MGFLQSSLVMLPQKNKTTTSTITHRILRFVPTKKLDGDKEMIQSQKKIFSRLKNISDTLINDDLIGQISMLEYKRRNSAGVGAHKIILLHPNAVHPFLLK